jgi:2-iminobutanoate/2-iminopropanoate deaminase
MSDQEGTPMAFAAAMATAAAGTDDIEILRSDAVNPPGLPFSDGVRIGRLVIMSGMLGIKPHTMELAAGGLEGETRQTFDNLRSVLAAHGLSLRDVVRVQVMLADIADWPRFNEIYREYFSEPFPARSAFGTTGLALGARVEVEAFVVRR